jgi:histidine triad (HIT) family protein
MDDCIFCKIIAGEIPSHKIYEDDSVLALLDINPVSEGHVLVIPKAHAQNLFESSAEAVDSIMHTIQKLGAVIKESLGANGFNVTTNIGAASGQSVFHTHFHMIPRYDGDGLPSWPQKATDHAALGVTAVKIIENL